ncbi:hypothetical protein D0T53_01215 [Dysgonomonas sp. 216]|uniref:winged helix-turn-helix domain-containing protein n=1 Tax=Dysgonomonas sp. 216 TaxID=2302934 RepID=UPI0013CF66BF|nr:winged helix-turn-helix domain-containing protein [Dysgonomonas sp. 216]NDW17533.1 hypothetical protein [Dysgonomonas sp. 216]
MKEKIGFNAGAVWSYLDENGAESLKVVKKACKLTDKDLYAALGWLAREDKVDFEETKEDIIVKLK